jgi:hypothetical protein
VPADDGLVGVVLGDSGGEFIDGIGPDRVVVSTDVTAPRRTRATLQASPGSRSALSGASTEQTTTESPPSSRSWR